MSCPLCPIPVEADITIIHQRETTDGHREDLREFLEPVFDPFLAVLLALAQQDRRRTLRVMQW